MNRIIVIVKKKKIMTVGARKGFAKYQILMGILLTPLMLPKLTAKAKASLLSRRFSVIPFINMLGKERKHERINTHHNILELMLKGN